MALQRKVKEVESVPLQYTVRVFASFMLFSRQVKKALSIQYTTLELFMCVVYNHYTNGKGCTVTSCVKMIYPNESGSVLRSVQQRFVTLVKMGLVYSVRVGGRNYYYLSDKAKTILEEVNRVKRK